MKKLLGVVAVILICTGLAYALPSMAVRDENGDLLNINSDGSINISIAGTTTFNDTITETYGVVGSSAIFNDIAVSTITQKDNSGLVIQGLGGVKISTSASITTLTLATNGTLTSIAPITATEITGTSFVIGANTLDTNEWAKLDGANQSVATTSNVSFSTAAVTTNFVLTGVIGAALPNAKPVNSVYWLTTDNKIYRSTETTTGVWSWVSW